MEEMTKELEKQCAGLIARVQNYVILKEFIKSEYKEDKFLSLERINRFIEILEKSENND